MHRIINHTWIYARKHGNKNVPMNIQTNTHTQGIWLYAKKSMLASTYTLTHMQLHSVA